MDFDTIVYFSKYGHTTQYAQMLSEITNVPAVPLVKAVTDVPQGSKILYMGSLMASHVRGYKKAAREFSISVVCGVGSCDTGSLLNEVRKATAIPADTPLFTLQGGMDRSKLKGLDRLIISALTKALESQKDRSEQDERTLQLLKCDENLVKKENLKDLLHAIGVKDFQ